MNITDAAYAVAHDYPGGTESLAPRLGMSGALLRNKVNQNNTTHHLTLAEAVRMSDITNDLRILESWAKQAGRALFELPVPENCADADVIELMARTWETNGDIGREVNETFKDGRVEPHEVRRVKDSAWTHMVTLLSMITRIEGMAEK